MRFGFMFYGMPTIRTEEVLALARATEDAGFDSFWVPEHQALYPEAADEMAAFGMTFDHTRCHPDSLQVLALAGAVTSRVQLASFLLLPCHHPVPLAKALATLDVLTGGRVLLCVGVGDLIQELEACGASFRTRGRRSNEAIGALRALWRGGDGGVSVDGEFFQFSNLVSRPRPLQAGGIPIHIGGASKAAARRAGQLGDGFYPSYTISDAEFIELVGRVRIEASEAGRDPATVEVSRTAILGAVSEKFLEEMADLGVARVVLMTPKDPNSGKRICDMSRLVHMISEMGSRFA
jgi:probable F420-dependent oxidoreductase